MRMLAKVVVGFCFCSVLCGAASGGSGSGLSNIIEICNEPSDGPVVTSVSSAYSGQNKHAYFLAGIALSQEFTVKVDWNGEDPGQVKWYRNSTLIATDQISGDSVSRTLNVGTEFNAGDRLYVQAFTGDGTASASKCVNFSVIPIPPGLQVVGLSFTDTGVGGTSSPKYKSFPFNIGFPELEEDKSSSNDDNTLSDNAKISWKSVIEVTAETDLNGHTEIKAGSDYLSLSKSDFKLANVSVGGNLKVILTFDYAQGEWKPGGGFDLGVSGKYSSPPSYVVFMVGPVPVPTYYRFAVDAGVSANCRFTGGSANLPVFTGDIPVGAGLEGMAGVGGADMLAIEGYLRGGVNWDFQVPQEPLLKDWYLSLNGGIRIYITFYKLENELLSYRWPQAASAMSFDAMSLISENLEPMSRDYLSSDYATWHGDAGMIKAQALGAQAMGGGGTETTLQTNVFGQSDAVLAVSGNTKCLVWLFDDPSRASLDRTMLVYSVNDGSGWTAPQAVDDDGTADATPTLAVDSNGDFLCAWANASQLIPDGSGLTDFADKLDIQMARYDSGTDTWTSETVAAQPHLDYNPKLACGDSGDVTVVWTHDDNNDMLAENLPVANTVLARTKTAGGWGAAETLATITGLVKYTDAIADATAKRVVCSVDTDSDWGTDGDNELFYIDDVGAGWSTPAQLTSNPNADVNPQFVQTSSDLMLVWARDGKIVSTTDIVGMTGVTDVVPEKGSSGQRGFTAAVSPTDNISVTWNDPSPSGSDIYTATYDPTIMAWSDTVQVTDSRDMERSISAAYSAGDTLELAYNKVHIEDADGLDAFGQVDLCTYVYQIGADLGVVADSIIIDDPNATPGDTVTLQATIANTGDTAVSDVPVAFYCGPTAEPGNQIGTTQIISGSLAAGQTAQASVSWTIPESDEPLNIIVLIDPDLQIEDKNRLNNTASTQMFGADVALTNVIVTRGIDRDFYVTADVVNTGFVPVADQLNLSLADQNDLDTVYDTQQIAIPDPAGSHTVTLVASSSDLAYGLNRVRLAVDADDQLNELSELDNSRDLTLNNNALGDLVVDGLIDEHDLAIMAEQWLQEPGSPSADIAPLVPDDVVNFEDFSKMVERWLQSVLPPDEFLEGFESGDFDAAPWQFGGDADWTIVSDTTYDGAYAARSGSVSHSQNTSIEITLDTPFETITFYWKVSSESNYDYLRFHIDGEQQDAWSGNQDWAEQTYSISPGEHTFKWSYTKDGSVSNGSDCAWVDSIQLY